MARMKKPPLIGMTYSDMAIRDEQMKVRTYCTRKYYTALQRAGAQVVLLPPVSERPAMERYLDLVQALLLPGGEDLDPRFQNEEPSTRLGVVNPFRDQFELEMARLAYARRMPTLGICRGIQVMAVAMGGAVHQDINHLKGILQHYQQAPRWASSHRVVFDGSTQLSDWMGKNSVFVNSFHHQSVKKLPVSLKEVGHSGDGLIEALESVDDRVFIGVQWHPEEMCQADDQARRLFEAFIAEAARN